MRRHFGGLSEPEEDQSRGRLHLAQRVLCQGVFSDQGQSSPIIRECQLRLIWNMTSSSMLGYDGLTGCVSAALATLSA